MNNQIQIIVTVEIYPYKVGEIFNVSFETPSFYDIIHSDKRIHTIAKHHCELLSDHRMRIIDKIINEN